MNCPGYRTNVFTWYKGAPPPSVVTYEEDDSGTIVIPIRHSDTCPPTHFQCREGYCLPVHTICNGIFDCLGHEDEIDCERLPES